MSASAQPAAVLPRIARGIAGQFVTGVSVVVTMVEGEPEHGLARRFARSDRGQGWDAFAGVPLWRQEPWPPVLADAIVWAVCRVARVIEVGDHRCYIGEILAAERDDMAAPLAYYRGRFRALGAAVAPTAWAMDSSEDPTQHW